MSGVQFGLGFVIVIWLCGLGTGWFIGSGMGDRKRQKEAKRLNYWITEAASLIAAAAPVMEESGEEGPWFGHARRYLFLHQIKEERKLAANPDQSHEEK